MAYEPNRQAAPGSAFPQSGQPAFGQPGYTGVDQSPYTAYQQMNGAPAAQTGMNPVQIPYAAQAAGYQTAQQPFNAAAAGYQTAQTPFNAANAGYQTAQTPFSAASAGYQTAQTPFSAANTGYQTAQTPFSAANTGFQTAQAPFSAASAGYQTGAQPVYTAPQPVQTPFGASQQMNTYPYQADGQVVTGQSVAQPKVKTKPERLSVDMEKFVKPFVVIGLPVLMLLFVLCMVLGGALWLKWVFVALAFSVVGVMWLNHDCFQRDMMLTFTFVLGALTVVTLVSAVLAAGQQPHNGPTVTPSPTSVTVSIDANGSISPATVALEQPPAMAEMTPAPAAADSGMQSAAVERMTSFLHFWKAGTEYDSMVEYCLPSWRNAQRTDPRNVLFQEIIAGRKLIDYNPISISGTDNDVSRTVTCEIWLQRAGASKESKYIFKIVMTRENDQWYVDPRSLESNEKATATPVSAESTQPPTPAPAANDNVLLYYNPSGGKLYHIDPNCRAVGDRFKPLQGTFTYGELGISPYSDLTNCPTCGAPLRKKN